MCGMWMNTYLPTYQQHFILSFRSFLSTLFFSFETQGKVFRFILHFLISKHPWIRSDHITHPPFPFWLLLDR
jgi:hypothetical protein